MRNILFSIYNLGNGGAERSLVNLLNEIDYSKYSIDIQMFTREGMFLTQIPREVNILPEQPFLGNVYAMKRRNSLNYCLDHGYKVVTTLLSQMVEKEKNDRKAYRYLEFYNKKVVDLQKHYDVAIAYISGDVLFFTVDHVNADKKYVFIHNDYKTAKHAKKYEKSYFNKVDRMITISETCAEVLRNEFPQYANKVLYLPNIVSSTSIRKRADESYPEEFKGFEGIRIVSIGRLNQQKGFDLAIDAAAILKKSGVVFRWLIIGNGELEEQLRKRIIESGVSDCIELIGPRENPYTYIKTADIVVQSSRYEGKSVVLDETKIIGTPIVSTNYPTAKDQICDGQEGLIVDLTAEGIADGILRITDPVIRDTIHDYLISHNYGNADKVKEYYRIFDE